MERLTKRTQQIAGHNLAYVSAEDCFDTWGVPKTFMGNAIDRLAAIEDVLGNEYDLDRLAELAQTDREGRVVVLPFKPPKWVWMCSRKFPKPAQAHYDSAINILCDMDRGCVFGDTPEEAEEALKAREQE